VPWATAFFSSCKWPFGDVLGVALMVSDLLFILIRHEIEVLGTCDLFFFKIMLRIVLRDGKKIFT
jgi:hypothetical protein